MHVYIERRKISFVLRSFPQNLAAKIIHVLTDEDGFINQCMCFKIDRSLFYFKHKLHRNTLFYTCKCAIYLVSWNQILNSMCTRHHRYYKTNKGRNVKKKFTHPTPLPIASNNLLGIPTLHCACVVVCSSGASSVIFLNVFFVFIVI